MRRRCRHRRNEFIWRNSAGLTVKRQCAVCMEWLPLGPARDTERTRIEVRAGEIAADIADAGGCLMTTLEQWGFNHTIPPLRGGGVVLMNSASQQSGWLARCIVETEDDNA